ncbi:MAG: phytanoyl-CoA dioxygenase family protein [Planctomycetaceae bacterium]
MTHQSFLNANQLRELDRSGWLLVPQFIPPATQARLRTLIQGLFAEEGDRAGHEFKQEAGCRRLANLVDKAPLFGELLLDSRLHACVAAVLGREFKLSSNNARCVLPHSNIGQPLHADMGAVADADGFWVCNIVWMLDDFTPDNGALRIVPGSHHWGQLPQDVLADPMAAHPDQHMVTGSAGDLIVLNAHAWHAGLPNRSASERLALHSFFARRDKPQQQYQKGLIRRDVQLQLPPALRHLLALDDPANDQLSDGEQKRSGFLT